MTNRENPPSATPIHLDSPFHVVVAVCSVAFLSYLAAKLGGALVLRPEMIWPVWPGCAFLVAVLLLTPRKLWPVLLIAGLAAFALYDAQEHLPIRATTWLLVADSIEILIASVGVSYVFGGVPRLNSLESLAKYSLFAVILAPISVASAAAVALEGDSWWVGFFTEALGLLTLTPAILGLADIAQTRVKTSKMHYLEAASVCIGLATVSYFAFVVSGSGSRPALIYSLVPFLLWAALRFGITGTATSMVLVTFVAILGVVHRRGPFTGSAPVTDVLSLQLFLLVAGASFMVLAAVVEEHKAAARALGTSEERLRLAAQVGRMFAYSWDVTTDVIERSGESSEILGVKKDDAATGSATYAMVLPDDRPRLEAVLSKLTVNNPTLQITYRIVRPDGVVIWVERISRAYFDESGNLERMVGMVVDVTERKRGEEALAGMTRKLIEAQEQERARIGRELHDDINQRLAMLSLELENIKADPTEMQQRMPELLKQATEISTEVQALSHELHPSKLEYLGIVGGIRSWCREFGERQGFEINYNTDVARTISPEVGVTLFRILQEALHNAVKHSGVKRIEVQLLERPNGVHLTISDAGKGFDILAARRSKGLGLTSMEERVRLVNGTIAIESKPMGGTTIHVHAPFKSDSTIERAAG
jgi:PAS domain S-box-containing protein